MKSSSTIQPKNNGIRYKAVLQSSFEHRKWLNIHGVKFGGRLLETLSGSFSRGVRAYHQEFYWTLKRKIIFYMRPTRFISRT